MQRLVQCGNAIIIIIIIIIHIFPYNLIHPCASRA
jgi:hypothetical protein